MLCAHDTGLCSISHAGSLEFFTLTSKDMNALWVNLLWKRNTNSKAVLEIQLHDFSCVFKVKKQFIPAS